MVGLGQRSGGSLAECFSLRLKGCAASPSGLVRATAQAGQKSSHSG